MKNLIIVMALLLITVVTGCKEVPRSAAAEDPSIAAADSTPAGFACETHANGWTLRYAATFETSIDPATQGEILSVRAECAAYEDGSLPSSIVRTHIAPSAAYDSVACVITLDDADELFSYSADQNGARGVYSDDGIEGMEVDFESQECEAL